jgi:hypothetical protein
LAIFSRKRAVTRRPRGQALTAAAVRLDRGDNDVLRRLQQGWQERAFGYYQVIPEIWYASQFYARSLAMLELYVGKVNPETGDIDKVEDEDVQGYVERIQDPGGGRANMLASYGRLMFITGESFLLVTEDEVSGDERWEMLSIDELRPTGQGTFTRYKAPSLNATEIPLAPAGTWEPLPPECIAYRLWRKHPRYSALADAPMCAVLDICEELLVLTQAVRSRALSRIPAGILVIPDEISFPNAEAVGDEDPAEDEFMAEIEQHFVDPIQNPGSASAAAPFLMRVAYEYADKLKMVEVQDPTKFYPEEGLRMECIKRIALGLDMPPEVLLGVADANHWTAWNIDEQTWKANLQPIAQTLVDDLTGAYLKPAMRADGFADWREYVIAYDASAIINHPDRAQDAKDLHAQLAISDRTLRESAGFNDTDAITDPVELRRRLGVQLRDPSVAIYGIPGRVTNVEPAPGELEAPDPNGGAPDAAAPASPGAPAGPSKQVGPPAEPTERAALPPAQRAAATEEMLRGAMQIAVQRCRELAGSRIISRAQHVPEAKEIIGSVQKGGVAHALGEAKVRQLVPGGNARSLVRGGSDSLASTLLEWGIDNALASRTCQAVEQHAARTLWDESPSLPQEMSA